MRMVKPRRWVVVVLIVAAVLVTGAVVADRIAARMVADRLSQRLGCVAGLADPPAVSVHGVLFVTQLLQRHFGEVALSATDLRRGELVADRVEVVADDVRVPSTLLSGDAGPHTVTIGSVRADITVAYGQLPVPDGRPAAISGADGFVVIATTATVMGQTVPVTVYAKPTISADTLTITPVEVEVLGFRTSADRLPGRQTQGQRLSRQLPTLPAGLGYQGVTATDDGLRITVGGDGLTATIGAGDNDKKCGGSA